MPRSYVACKPSVYKACGVRAPAAPPYTITMDVGVSAPDADGIVVVTLGGGADQPWGTPQAEHRLNPSACQVTSAQPPSTAVRGTCCMQWLSQSESGQ
jgi:hypothetical protein